MRIEDPVRPGTDTNGDWLFHHERAFRCSCFFSSLSLPRLHYRKAIPHPQLFFVVLARLCSHHLRLASCHSLLFLVIRSSSSPRRLLTRSSISYRRRISLSHLEEPRADPNLPLVDVRLTSRLLFSSLVSSLLLNHGGRHSSDAGAGRTPDRWYNLGEQHRYPDWESGTG